MANMQPKRPVDGDERNAAFELPEELAEHKPGHERQVARREAETGNDERFPVSKEKDIPQESLAARIAKSRKER